MLPTLVTEENSILEGELIKAEHMTISFLSVNSFCLSVQKVHRQKIKDPGPRGKMTLELSTSFLMLTMMAVG